MVRQQEEPVITDWTVMGGVLPVNLKYLPAELWVQNCSTFAMFITSSLEENILLPSKCDITSDFGKKKYNKPMLLMQLPEPRSLGRDTILFG